MKPKSRTQSVAVIGMTVALLAAVLGWGAYQSGSFASALPYLSGDRLLVSAHKFDFGQSAPEQVLEFQVSLANLSGEPVTLLGHHKSCSCVTTEAFPLKLPHGARRDLNISLKLPKATDRHQVTQHVIYYTDYKPKQRLVVTLTGEVVPKAD
jgi:hypothetical protein